MKLTTIDPNIIGMNHDEIELRPHNPKWLKIGEDISCKLSTLLKKNDQKHFIAHVGSTSIPTIQAKPIIDISIVTDPKNDEDCQHIIETTYENSYLQGYWQLSFHDTFTDKIFCNVHVMPFTEPLWRHFFALKKYFIENPDEAKQYEKLKLINAKNYANSFPDYTFNKTDFLNTKFQKANEIYSQDLNDLVYQTFN